MANEPPDFTHSRNVVQTRANPLLPALERSVDGYGGLSSSGAQNCISPDALVAILSALKSATNAGQFNAIDTQNFGCGVDVAGTSQCFDMLCWRQRSGALALLLVGIRKTTH